jgi:4-hydroxy-3-polyprenylbenzoate decarboxylase
MPEGLDELLLGGFLARRRIEMVKCVTIDLDVPASSHIVLEGYVEPGERRREGPFGDHTGFYSQPDDYPVFILTCITRRKRYLPTGSVSHRWRTSTWGWRASAFSCP